MDGQDEPPFLSISHIRSLPSREIILPDNVSGLEDECFSCCESLEKIVIPNGITSIPYEAFSGSGRLQEVIIPDTVVSIAPGAFCGCKALHQIELPKHLKYLGACTFLGCDSLRSIVFPVSLEDIGYAAFKGCTLLSDVSVPMGYTIPYERHAFDGCSSLNAFALPIDYCQMEVGNAINELSYGFDVRARVYLDGLNSQYSFDLYQIDTPNEDDIGSMVDIGDGLFDYLMRSIKGSWLFFREGSLSQSNIERIETADIQFIYTIISDTLRSIEAKLFHCSDEGIQKYGADYFDLRGVAFHKSCRKVVCFGYRMVRLTNSAKNSTNCILMHCVHLFCTFSQTSFSSFYDFTSCGMTSIMIYSGHIESRATAQ